MSKLALGTILAGAAFFISTAKLGLVSGGDWWDGSDDFGRGQRAVAQAQAWWRRGQRLNGRITASKATHVSLVHTNRAVHSEWNVVERRAGQMLAKDAAQGPEAGVTCRL